MKDEIFLPSKFSASRGVTPNGEQVIKLDFSVEERTLCFIINIPSFKVVANGMMDILQQILTEQLEEVEDANEED